MKNAFKVFFALLLCTLSFQVNAQDSYTLSFNGKAVDVAQGLHFRNLLMNRKFNAKFEFALAEGIQAADGKKIGVRVFCRRGTEVAFEKSFDSLKGLSKYNFADLLRKTNKGDHLVFELTNTALDQNRFLFLMML